MRGDHCCWYWLSAKSRHSVGLLDLRIALGACISELLRGDELDMPEVRPVLTGDEQGALLAIIGDAVQHMRIDEPRGLRVQTVEIDPARDFPCLGREAHKVIVLPDIGVDLTVNILELVQEADF